MVKKSDGGIGAQCMRTKRWNLINDDDDVELAGGEK